MRKCLCLCLSVVLGSPFIASQNVFAEEHVVSSGELRQRLQAASGKREQNLAQFDKLLSHDSVRGALETARLNPGQVRNAAAMLTDDELSRLADRSAKVERDLAAGSLTNQQLTYIVIALATAVIILVIVAR